MSNLLDPFYAEGDTSSTAETSLPSSDWSFHQSANWQSATNRSTLPQGGPALILCHLWISPFTQAARAL